MNPDKDILQKLGLIGPKLPDDDECKELIGLFQGDIDRLNEALSGQDGNPRLLMAVVTRHHGEHDVIAGNYVDRGFPLEILKSILVDSVKKFEQAAVPSALTPNTPLTRKMVSILICVPSQQHPSPESN